MAREDISGQKFERLLVLRYIRTDCVQQKNNNRTHFIAMWECLCDCGTTKIVSGPRLKSGGVRSCGCLQREVLAKNGRRLKGGPGGKIRHGHCKNGKMTKIYHSWCGMIQRITNRNRNQFYRYGGRGITVNQRWQIFDNFLEDMGSTWFLGANLHRLNNDLGYSKDNCIWLEASVHQRIHINQRIYKDSPKKITKNLLLTLLSFP